VSFRDRNKAVQLGATAPARVYTLSPGGPFLAGIAEALLRGDLPRPGGRPPSTLELADITVLLPTRRAVRAAQDAFLKASRGKALLLPKLRPIAEGDEELCLLSSGAGEMGPAAAVLDLPPAISEAERQLALTGLVLRWLQATAQGAGARAGPPAGARTPAQAAKLARELARLMDNLEIENVPLSGLSGLVPDVFSEHWGLTVEFLGILAEHWPQYLNERGLISRTERRNRLILAEAQRLRTHPPDAPVIVAGVTGSVPATSELMSAVAALPNGALVLPGLDRALDEESWQAIARHPEHPQFGLAKLLRALGLSRSDVATLPGPPPDRAKLARHALVSEAMRPAATTERWHRYAAAATASASQAALQGVCVLEAASADEEAEAIALILREAVETPGRTAALVSPDRLLARRVKARLEAWGLRVDDSAGRPFAKTVPGAFLDLVAEAVAARFEPAAMMALLKHPLCRLGWAPARIRRAARALELAALRAPYFGNDLEAVEVALERARVRVRSGGRCQRAQRWLRDEDWQMAAELVAALQQAFRPMRELFALPATRLRTIAAAHIATAEALAKTATDESECPLWKGEEGEAAAKLFANLLDAASPDLEIAASDYPDLYRTLISEENVRSREPAHPRLFLWGLLEARLQQPDVVVLGSLNEGVWPAFADPGPWLNRPMRAALGLPAPEERIGRAAHDFTSLMEADRVFLTRAAKVDGVPTVPSRWLLRLKALVGGIGLGDALEAEARQWLGWAQARNSIQHRRSLKPPEPRPPVMTRPRKLSVTAVELWIKNPYAIFARHILELEPLPELGQRPNAALRGGIVHEALSRFSKRYPERLPEDIAKELLATAKTVLAEYTGDARIAAFWVPRFVRFAQWFADTEPARRSGVVHSLAEIRGESVLVGPAGRFILTARADRIDVRTDGLVITDYKTSADIGGLVAQAKRGEAVQLALEAAIAASGGFDQVPARPVLSLRYISASGAEPPGKEIVLGEDVAALCKNAREGLQKLVVEFDSASTPYRALRRPQFSYDYDEYAHLARVAEWSANGIEEG
jgi:ATP-dependent helicase/nuclease subunit B